MHQMAKGLPLFIEHEACMTAFPYCVLRHKMRLLTDRECLFTDCAFAWAGIPVDKQPDRHLVHKSPFIDRFTDLAHELMKCRHKTVRPYGRYYTLTTPYAYFLPSQLQKLLELCDPEQFLFGGSLHEGIIGGKSDALNGLFNQSAWYVQAKEICIDQYYQWAVDGAADFMFAEDGSIGFVVATNGDTTYNYFIMGDEQKVKKFEDWDKRRANK